MKQSLKIKEIFYIKPKLLGIFLMSLILAVFGMFINPPLTSLDLDYIKGEIKGEIEFGTQGGDMPREYCKICLKKQNKEFYLQDCSYLASNITKVKKLRSNDLIEIGVKKVNKTQEKIVIFSLSSKKYGSILKVSNYNKCKNKIYRIFLLVALCLGLIILFQVYKNFKSIYPR